MSDSGKVRAVLSTVGRKSGKYHSVQLLAVKYGSKIYFSRHMPDSDWFKNALNNPKVKVKVDQKEYEGVAKQVLDEDLASKISELKYPGQQKAKEKRVVLEVTLYELV